MDSIELTVDDRPEETVARLIAEAEAATDPRTRAARLRRAADVYERDLGDGASALMVLQAAFFEDTSDDACAGELERLAERLGEGASLVVDGEARAADLRDPRQRARLLVRVARWQLRFLGDDRGAEANLLEALRAAPGEPAVNEALRELQRARGDDEGEVTPPPVAEGPERLLATLDQHVAAARWQAAVDVLGALASGESGELRSRYLATAGRILHHKLGRDDDAIVLLNQAMDADPFNLSAFERIYRILAARRDWQNAESNLLRMIARVEPSNHSQRPRALEALWRRLGDVYRLGLKDLPAAVTAYTTCARLAPNDPRYPQLLSEIQRRGY